MIRQNRGQANSLGSGNQAQTQAVPVPEDVDEAIRQMTARLGHGDDIVVRRFRYGLGECFAAALIYIDGMTNAKVLDQGVLQPLLNACPDHPYDMETFAARYVAVASVALSDDLNTLVKDVLGGNALFFGQRCRQALSIGVRHWVQRGLDEPSTETVVRGPHQGFTETLRTNTVLLRRILQNPQLRVDMLKIGANTSTDVAVVYLENIVLPGLVQEIKTRLGTVKSDKIVESGVVQMEISDSPKSLFDTMSSSERPDSVALQLLNGRAAIIVDGSPFVLTAPCLFLESFRNPEDFYIKQHFALMLLLLRLLSYVLTILAPAIYVALTTFHQELIPTSLLFTMTSGRQNTPFPASIEALLMIAMFDILKEAGVRLPKPIGPAISIVGALVLGQSAVDAGLVGPFMVIVVATTAIAGFAIPSQLSSSAILRYIFLVTASLMGGFGIVMTGIVLAMHLVSLESFGVPFLAPLAPTKPQWLLAFSTLMHIKPSEDTHVAQMQELRTGQDNQGGTS